MKRYCILSVFIPFLIYGCSVVNRNVIVQEPMTVNEISFSDLQSAARKSVDVLLAADVIKEKERSKPFVMVGKMDNKFIPHVNTDIISQDIRLAILMSDKAVTMSEDIQRKSDKQDKKKKPGNTDALPVFDYFLLSEIVKDKITTPEGDKECFSVRLKLKDLKNKLVVWEDDVKLLK